MYFGDFVTSASTFLLIIEFGYILYTLRKGKDIQYWGRRIAFLVLWGLILCCFVAARDNYHLSVQAHFDGSLVPGIFVIDSIQSTICSIAGGVIAFSAISSIIIKKQTYRKVIFWVLCAVIVMKTVVIEISRWMI